MIRGTKKIIFRYILQNSYAPFLKYLYHKFLGGFPRNTWCRGLWQDLTPFLESSEFSMSCGTTFWAQKCLFVVKILSQSCNFWCTWKNEENGHLEFSNHKNRAFPLLSKIFDMILQVYNFFNFLQGCHLLLGLLWHYT